MSAVAHAVRTLQRVASKLEAEIALNPEYTEPVRSVYSKDGVLLEIATDSPVEAVKLLKSNAEFIGLFPEFFEPEFYDVDKNS